MRNKILVLMAIGVVLLTLVLIIGSSANRNRQYGIAPNVAIVPGQFICMNWDTSTEDIQKGIQKWMSLRDGGK